MKSRPPYRRIIPYGRQSINHEDRKAVEKTLSSDWLTQGPVVTEFEEQLAKYCGTRFALAVSSGTAALHLAYLSAGIGKGDEVITTPNTFVATTNMLLTVGAKPVFCDIRLDTYNIDETKIEALITKKTKAIVPVHFAGQPCEMQAIRKIAKKHRLLVIEDACHALGASFLGKKVGSIGDLTVFSFHPVKSITTGEGGAVLTNDKKFYERMKLLRSHGIEKDSRGFNVMNTLGYNYRMNDIQASLGVSQLQRLDSFIAKRRAVVSWYRALLSANKDLTLPRELPGARNAWHLFVVRTARPEDRLPLYAHLQKAGIGVNFHYPPVYSHPYYRAHGYVRLALPKAEHYAATVITLPLYPDLKRFEVAFVCAKIREYFHTHGNH